MKVAYLISPRRISITLPKPGCIVHLYFLDSGPDFSHSLGGTASHFIPGISSVTVTVVGPPSDSQDVEAAQSFHATSHQTALTHVDSLTS